MCCYLNLCTQIQVKTIQRHLTRRRPGYWTFPFGFLDSTILVLEILFFQRRCFFNVVWPQSSCFSAFAILVFGNGHVCSWSSTSRLLAVTNLLFLTLPSYYLVASITFLVCSNLGSWASLSSFFDVGFWNSPSYSLASPSWFYWPSWVLDVSILVYRYENPS